jgi:hypothetical protein
MKREGGGRGEERERKKGKEEKKECWKKTRNRLRCCGAP